MSAVERRTGRPRGRTCAPRSPGAAMPQIGVVRPGPLVAPGAGHAASCTPPSPFEAVVDEVGVHRRPGPGDRARHRRSTRCAGLATAVRGRGPSGTRGAGRASAAPSRRRPARDRRHAAPAPMPWRVLAPLIACAFTLGRPARRRRGGHRRVLRRARAQAAVRADARRSGRWAACSRASSPGRCAEGVQRHPVPLGDARARRC